MLTILAGVATWEREIMLERQREGIAKAKAAGKYKGRPVSIDRARFKKLMEQMGPADVARTMRIARSHGGRCLIGNCNVRYRRRKPFRIAALDERLAQLVNRLVLRPLDQVAVRKRGSPKMARCR